MKLQVEEDAVAAPTKCLDQGIPSGVVELHANLEPAAAALEAVDQGQRGIGVWNIERDSKAVFSGEIVCQGVHSFSLAESMTGARGRD